MIGVFFSLVIPGAVSGDVVKLVYISGRTGGRTTEAGLTIMLDRVLGLLGLFFVATVSIIISRDYLEQASTPIQIGAAVVGGGSAAGMLCVLAVSMQGTLKKWLGISESTWNRLDFLPEKVIDITRRLSAAFTLYRSHRRAIVYALMLSVSVHTLLSIAVFSVGRGFHEIEVGPRQYVLTAQVANAMGAIPITPAGIGSRV